jgi:hypothetical protein
VRPAPRAPRGSCRRLAAAGGLLLLTLLAGAPTPARAEEPQEKVADSPYPVEFRERVNAAIDRGARWLRQTQRGDGTWQSPTNRGYPMGSTALATLTLLKCGAKPDEPVVEKAFAFLRTQPLTSTYEVGVLLMAIAARYAPAQETFAAESEDRYGPTTKPKDPCETGISKDDLAWMKRGVEFLIAEQNADGVWRYPGGGGGTDLSNTQYALLGLQAANRCGDLVPPKVWLAALEYLVAKQEAFGRPCVYKGNEVRGRYRFQWSEPALARGFRYIPGQDGWPVTGSMTTAGLAGLIICQSELWGSRRFTAELRQKTRHGIRDAMAWLQQHYDVTTNPTEPPPPGAAAPRADPLAGFPGDSGWYHYYMYGLERAGILGRFRFLGPHDWYLDGAEALMRQQAPQGSFGGDLNDTCFALLFLKRATTRHQAPVITPSDGSGQPPK